MTLRTRASVNHKKTTPAVDVGGGRKRGGRSGGPATGGGINFQAAVTTIAVVHTARNRPLDWLKGVVDDTPLEVWSETGGPGDDLRLLLKNNENVEVQVKKGLRAGADLWNTLISLATGISGGRITYGVLVVCPETSEPVASRLAEDIVRIGEGRTDGVSNHGETFKRKLIDLGLNAKSVCQRLRIRRVHALAYDDADLRASRTELEQILDDGREAGKAFDGLYRDSCRLIEYRGSRNISSILKLLQSIGVVPGNIKGVSPGSTLKQLTDWTKATNGTLTFLGSQRILPIVKAWIELKAFPVDNWEAISDSLKDALDRYHKGHQHQKRNPQAIDAATIGRFRRECVVVAGPGMGKSTLLKRLAYDYAEDELPVLRVDLKAVATKMQKSGAGFVAAVFEIGFDGAPLTVEHIMHSGIGNWVLLCDGLDETGSFQDAIAEGAAKFLIAYPMARIVVTTRPIGYQTGYLSTWRHYELASLERTFNSAQVAQLLELLLPEEPVNEVSEIARKALRSDTINALISRSPLLVSLAAVLLARGRILGDTKISLYAEIMKLVEDEPSRRLVELNLPTNAILRNFVRKLGWELHGHPLSSSEDISKNCSLAIAKQLNITKLSAEALVEQCFTYWEQLGIIERVRHGGEEAVTFVHKTLGEFSAAKYLLDMQEEEQVSAISSIVNSEAWWEVLNFAASMGASTVIAEQALAHAVSQSGVASAVVNTLQMMVEADEPPGKNVRQQAIKLAVDLIQSDRRIIATRVGLALANAAKKFPNEILPTIGFLKNHNQGWTRLASWACLLSTNNEHFNLPELRNVIKELSKSAPTMKTSLMGHIVMDNSSERSLTEASMLNAIEVLLTRFPEEADALVPHAINDVSPACSTRFFEALERLLASHQKVYPIEILSRFGKNLTDFFQNDEWMAQEREFCRVVFSSIVRDLESSALPATTLARPLFHLGAFVSFIKFGDRLPKDSSEFFEQSDVAAAAAVFRTLAVASGLSLDHLASDLKVLMERLDDPTATNVFTALEIAPDVDPPEGNWTKLQLSNYDSALLERALYNRSTYIVTLAVNCLGQLCKGHERRELVERLLETGEGISFAAATFLMDELAVDEAREILLTRLAKPLSDGSWHLFERLKFLAPPLDERLIGAMRSGFYVGPRTASATALVAAIHARPGVGELGELLAEAYSYWKEHEKPMPEGGGVIPDSPRAEILKSLFVINTNSVDQLLAYFGDRRSDVRDVVRNELRRLLLRSPSVRMEFVANAIAKVTPAGLLNELFREKIPFSVSEITQLTSLLSDSDAKYRFAAMALLDAKYMTRVDIQAFAKVLTNDSEPQVYEAAYQILEGKR